MCYTMHCIKLNCFSMQQETRAAFVSFRSRYGAAVAFHLRQSINPTQWVTEEAPEPDDVYWPFFSSSFMRRWISKLVVVVACILLTILFLIPVVVVQGLTNLSQLETWFPFLKSFLTMWVVILVSFTLLSLTLFTVHFIWQQLKLPFCELLVFDMQHSLIG